MKDWLVFRMGVATIRILIWNVTCMLHAEYRILLYVYCLILIGIQTPAISLFLLTSHASLNSRLLVRSLFWTNFPCDCDLPAGAGLLV